MYDQNLQRIALGNTFIAQHPTFSIFEVILRDADVIQSALCTGAYQSDDSPHWMLWSLFNALNKIIVCWSLSE